MRTIKGGEVADLIEADLRNRLAAHQSRPFVVGICGAQGSGKSTVTDLLVERLRASGLTAQGLSLDDLYLPKEERERLSALFPLLRTRGVPGTHDVGLGQALIAGFGRPGSVRPPRFSKALDTRLPKSEWPVIATPVDVVLFEGWCVGARPERAADLATPINALEREQDPQGTWRAWVNTQLGGVYQALFAALHMLVLLAPPDFGVVAEWRKEQEHVLRDSLLTRNVDASGALDDQAVERFVQHYQRITEHILREMPERAEIVLRLDAQRRPIAVTKAPLRD